MIAHGMRHLKTAMKLYTVASIWRSTGRVSAPRFDLTPMSHAAACNFMDACRSDFTDYKLIPWPESVPIQSPPLHAAGYRNPPLYSPRTIRKTA